MGKTNRRSTAEGVMRSDAGATPLSESPSASAPSQYQADGESFRPNAPSGDAAPRAIVRFLRSFHVLLRTAQLYQKNHPRILANLDAAERNLRLALEVLCPLPVGVERGGLALPHLGGSGNEPLEKRRAEFSELAQDLARCGVTSLVFFPETNVGELDTLAQLLNSSALKAAPARPSAAQDWPARFAEHRIAGIRVNVLIERQVETRLAGLVAGFLAYSGEEGPQ